MNAIRVPSGDQTGLLSHPGTSTTAWGFEPSAPVTHTSDSLPMNPSNAINDPSGDHVGLCPCPIVLRPDPSGATIDTIGNVGSGGAEPSPCHGGSTDGAATSIVCGGS